MPLIRKTKPYSWNRKHLLGLRELTAEDITYILDTARGFEQISTRSVKKAPPFSLFGSKKSEGRRNEGRVRNRVGSVGWRVAEKLPGF